MSKTVVTKTPMAERRRRASKACINCRKRKTKCVYDSTSAQCMRCCEEDLTCVISDIEKRGGYGNVLAGKEKKERRNSQLTLVNENAVSDEYVLKQKLYNPSDAIKILHCASHHPSAHLTSNSGTSKSAPDIGYDYGEASNRRLPIHASAIVVDRIISAEEAERLIGVFFTEVAPFYASYVPEEYRELSRIAAEPALLAALCTISARCMDEKAYSDLHIRLWSYCKHTISTLLWECPPHQIRSLVFAVLTIAEWFPGELLIPNSCAPGEALRRHTQMCWPLMGQIVRLARYVGLLRRDIQATIALHFTDNLLACRLGQQPMLISLDGNIGDEFKRSQILRCKPQDRARLDIVSLLHMANRVLYKSRAETEKLVETGQYSSVLELLDASLRRWKDDYPDIVSGKSWADRTIMFEFNHFELYVFSIALTSWQTPASASKMLDMQHSEKFLSRAINAAKAIIDHESCPDRPVKLRYSPIQWITRLLHASVFLAKALLMETVFQTNEQRHDIVHYLSTAASTLAQLPPDDQRIYSRPLENICKRFSVPIYTLSTPAVSEEAPDDNALDYMLDQDFLSQMLTEDVCFTDLFGFTSPQ